jgi:hypothetical protein
MNQGTQGYSLTICIYVNKQCDWLGGPLRLPSDWLGGGTTAAHSSQTAKSGLDWQATK